MADVNTVVYVNIMEQLWVYDVRTLELFEYMSPNLAELLEFLTDYMPFQKALFLVVSRALTYN